MKNEIKTALRQKNRVHSKYISGGRSQNDEINLHKATMFISNIISTSKNSYFTNLGKRLNDPNTNSKTYWSILNFFLDKIKIPEIPPLLVNGIFETDFRKKACIFNLFIFNLIYVRNVSSNGPGPAEHAKNHK